MAKITLTAAQALPLDKLVASAANVRRIKAGVSIEELAEDIGQRGLLQSLNVRAVLDESGANTGTYAVTAGGRRLAALKLLVNAKRLAKSAPVPCIVKGDGVAEEDSLAENTMREALHPLDQFRAFQVLRQEHGMGDEEIAARFFVTPAVVRQRLKLATVSPKLLEVYAVDGMSLEQLMAFTITSGHARQEEVWEAVQRGYNKEPYLIRRMLTEGKVAVTDRRAVFVGAEAYQAAGGTIARDLFQQDAGGWFEDAALLDRLVDEKLQAEAANVTAEGWRWVEVARDFPYGHTQGLRRVFARLEPLTDEELAELDALREEMERLEAEHADAGEDLPEEVDQRLAELEAAIAVLEDRTGNFEAADVAISGAFVSLSYEGRIRIERGYVRPQDELRSEADGDQDLDGPPAGSEICSNHETGGKRATTAIGGSSAPEGIASEEDESDPGKPLSERLVTELTAHRTLALREALANDPDVAFVAVLHALALRAFYGNQAYDPGSCLEIEAKSALLSGTAYGPSLGDTQSGQALARMHEAWAIQLPQQPADLWDWLLNLDSDTRSSLLAYCAARTLNAVHQPYDRRPSALAHATRLAQALSLDMAAQWSPTKETYLGRVTKAQILAALREAKGEATAQSVEHLKKDGMAEAAERLLAGTGWLPVILRTPGPSAADDHSGVQAGDGAAPLNDAAPSDIPAFLTAGDEALTEEARQQTDPVYGIAAE
jgi:ParB family chromosome partitioning protein